MPTARRSEVPCWKFEPQRMYGQDVQPSLIEFPVGDMVFTTRATSISRRYSNLEPNLRSIVIAVDGACSANGMATPEAAIGVYVGKDSEHNAAVRLDSGWATNQKAELIAGIYGLDAAREINDYGVDGKSLTQVIIKSDSAYLVNGLTQWAGRWETNGYINADGQQVTNHYLFKELTWRIRELADSRVKVYFWHVRREYNEEAHQLAGSALTR
ncbi:putative ribonuclease H [Microsporum ferrugineum]